MNEIATRVFHKLPETDVLRHSTIGIVCECNPYIRIAELNMWHDWIPSDWVVIHNERQ